MNGFDQRRETDERDLRSRKYELDYELRPGCTDERKSESYIYTGYYYSLDLKGSRLTFRAVRLLYIIVSVLQTAAVLCAGLLDSAMSAYTWSVWPYAGMMLSAGLAIMGAMEFIGCREEFVRRVRDKAAARFRTAQVILSLSSVVLLVVQAVYMIASADGRTGRNLCFLLICFAVALSAVFMVRFTAIHKPVIVRDGQDEFTELRDKASENRETE